MQASFIHESVSDSCNLKAGLVQWLLHKNRAKVNKVHFAEMRREMAQRGDLLSFRPDIKVLDATIRDGGLVNDFFFYR